MTAIKKTLVLGATDNPDRYANIAIKKLLKYNHEVVPVGMKDGEVAGLKILKGHPQIKDVDTVTLYVGTRNLPVYFDYILSLKPKRIIFNPGTEHPELEKLAHKNGIETVEGCTLVMLSMGNY